MTDLQGALNEIEEALKYCSLPPGSLPPENQAQFLVAQNALAKIQAIIEAVPEMLPVALESYADVKQFRNKNREQLVKASQLLHTITGEKNGD